MSHQLLLLGSRSNNWEVISTLKSVLFFFASFALDKRSIRKIYPKYTLNKIGSIREGQKAKIHYPCYVAPSFIYLPHLTVFKP